MIVKNLKLIIILIILPVVNTMICRWYINIKYMIITRIIIPTNSYDTHDSPAVLFYSNPNALLQLLSNDALRDAFTPDVLLPP